MSSTKFYVAQNWWLLDIEPCLLVFNSDSLSKYFIKTSSRIFAQGVYLDAFLDILPTHCPQHCPHLCEVPGPKFCPDYDDYLRPSSCVNLSCFVEFLMANCLSPEDGEVEWPEKGWDADVDVWPHGHILRSIPCPIMDYVQPWIKATDAALRTKP